MNSAVVLVVEDHPLIRLSAMELVEAAGFGAVGAENADAAIAILEARADIRLVFTDVEMPGSIDGLKLAHYIRDRWPPVHLIVVSGKGMLDENELPAGSRFFSKPYSDNTIVAEMTRLLGT
ncbi:MAG TPA: response regulator [Aestuariivirga sp.]